jgi:hypothetical protein
LDANGDLAALEGEWHGKLTEVDEYAAVVLVHDPERDLVARLKKENTGEEVTQLDDWEIERRRQLAAYRSRRGLKFKILAMRADRLFTLTKRGRIETLGQAWALWSKFEKEFSRLTPDFKCVVVPERHKKDGWHLHFACNQFFDVCRMRIVWHRVLMGATVWKILREEDSPGNVHVSRHANSKRKIAAYLAKYVGKDFGSSTYVDSVTDGDPKSGRIQKRYASSKGLPGPTVTKFRFPSAAGAEAFHLRGVMQRRGWQLQRHFECLVRGRRVIWVEFRKLRAAARSVATVSSRTLAPGGPAAYS